MWPILTTKLTFNRKSLEIFMGNFQAMAIALIAILFWRLPAKLLFISLWSNRAGGIIPTASGSASLASPGDALAGRAVELRSHPAMNEQSLPNGFIPQSALLILGPAGLSRLRRALRVWLRLAMRWRAGQSNCVLIPP